jgi:hypothetical protein
MSIVYDLANLTYRARPELSYSESKLLQQSAMHLRFWRDHPELRSAGSPAMAFGTMVHTATLEPTTFDQRYAVAPPVNKNTSAWKAFVAECTVASLLPITAEEREAAFTCAGNVRNHPVVGPLMSRGHAEVSCFWTDPATGVECKCRVDWLHPLNLRGVIPVDLKTTQDASRGPFTRSVVTYQYHRQAHWYEQGVAQASGLEVSPMLFVVVESKPPYAVAAYTLDRWFMAQAAKINHDLRSLYKHCLATNDWPGYDPAITDLTAPRWSLDDELRELQREEA